MFDHEYSKTILNSNKVNTIIAICAVLLFFAPAISVLLLRINALGIETSQERDLLIISLQLSVIIFFILALITNSRLRQIETNTIADNLGNILKKGTSCTYLDLRCMNAYRFMDYCQRKDITIENLRIFVPSKQAIREFYETLDESNYSDETKEYSLIKSAEKASTDVLNMRELTVNIISGMIDVDLVKNFKLIEMKTFPLDFVAIVDRGKKCLTGRYTPMRKRKFENGFGSRSWVEYNPIIKMELAADFERLWLAYSKLDE